MNARERASRPPVQTGSLSQNVSHQLYTMHLTFYVTAIPAQYQVPLSLTLAMPGMDSWNKPELVLFLRSHGEEPPKAWGKVELRQRIKDMVDQGEVELPSTTTQKKTPLQEATTAMNQASKKKSNLIRYAEENFGIRATSNDTIGTLQRKIMNHLLLTVKPVGQELMGFGKFSVHTYRQVLEEEPKYVEWACQTAHEGETSTYLKRFVRWVEDYAAFEDDVKVPVNAITKKKATAKATSVAIGKKSSGYSSVEPTETPSSGSASASNETIKDLTMMVAQLAQEVKSLKDDRAEKPRKLLAKPDAEMTGKQDYR